MLTGQLKNANEQGKKVTLGRRDAPFKETTTAKKAKLAHDAYVEQLMAKYEDCDPSGPKGRGGRPGLNLLDDVSQYTRFLNPSAGIKLSFGYRCKGAERGCATNWSGPRNSARVLAHASSCEKLPPEVIQRVNEHLASRSLSAKLGHITNFQSETTSKASSSQAILDAPNVSPANSLSGLSTASIKQRSVLEIARQAGRDKKYDQLDHDAMSFFVVNGIPPTNADSPEWKEMWQHAVPGYKPVSSTTLTNIHIPREASYVRSQVLAYLRTQDGLTLSFDGNTTRRVDSVYTAHVSTQERRVFLWDGNSTSAESHTAEHIANFLIEVCCFTLKMTKHVNSNMPSDHYHHRIRTLSRNCV